MFNKSQRVDFQQVEIEERRVVLAVLDLGFDAVTKAGPVEMVVALAE